MTNYFWLWKYITGSNLWSNYPDRSPPLTRVCVTNDLFILESAECRTYKWLGVTTCFLAGGLANGLQGRLISSQDFEPTSGLREVRAWLRGAGRV